MSSRILDSVQWRLSRGRFGRFIRDIVTRHPLYIGGPDPRSRVRLGRGVQLTDTVFNVASGAISLGDFVMVAHGVSLVAATHDLTLHGSARQKAIPTSGCDIVIEEGVFLGTGAIVIGPCRIGAHAVVGAGAVVTRDVAPGAVVGGAPARQLGH